jgi:hypothetical protein
MRKRGVLALLLCGACGSSPKPAVEEKAVVAAPRTPSCDDMSLDLIKGTITGVPVTATQDEVKAAFPCSTGESPDGELFNYGGGVFFLGHQLFFYTGRDFIQVRMGFVGAVVPPLLGAPPSAAEPELGDAVFDTGSAKYFSREGGCIAMTYDDTTITEVSTHRAACSEVKAMFEEG